MTRSREYDQARFLVSHIRSLGVEVGLVADCDGLWVEYHPLHPGIRLSAEVNSQITALAREILAVCYDENTRPIRLAGRRAG